MEEKPRGGDRRRTLRALALAGGCAVLAVVCATAGAERKGDTGRGGRIVIGVPGDVTSLNIYTATNAFSQEIVDRLFLKLADEQDDFSQGPPTFAPSLAKFWEISPDGLQLTFHLDARARWSDGRPVTARDVVFSHQAATSREGSWVGSDVKDFIADARAPHART